jgi:hypothetical protein
VGAWLVGPRRGWMGNQCFGIWRLDERGFLFARGRTGFCVDLGAKGVFSVLSFWNREVYRLERHPNLVNWARFSFGQGSSTEGSQKILLKFQVSSAL